MDEELNKKLIDSQLNSNAEALKGASIGDLLKKDSSVYRAPEVQKDPVVLPQKPKFDADGLPNIENVRTYQGDVANIVQHDNVSMSKMMVAEQQRQGHSGEGVLVDNKKSFKLHLVVGLVASILFLSGIGAVLYSFFIKEKNSAPIEIKETEKEIMRSDERIKINIENKKKEDVLGMVMDQINKIPEDIILRKVELIKNEGGQEAKTTLLELLNLAEVKIPETLSRNLYADYFFGINFVAYGKPFLVMFTSSYDVAYAGLLEWEKTMMEDFRNVSGKEYDPLKSYSFKDRIILNKDVRALQDGGGNIIFFYSIIDQNTIVFAKDAETLGEVMERLRIARLKK